MHRLSPTLSFLLLSCLTAVAPAQETPPPPTPPATPATPAQPTSPMEALRAKPAIADEDRAAIRNWLDPRITALASDNPGSAAAELRTEYGGTPAFKEAFAAIAIELARPALKKASPTAGGRVLASIGALADAPADAVSALMIENLKDERVAVRLAAAVGLRNLRTRLAPAGAGFVGNAVNALRDAGKTETSAAVLRAIYQALNYPEVVPSPPDPRVIAAAVVDLLDTRVKEYGKGEVKAEGAEVAGLRTAAALRASFDDDEKKRVTAAAATLLKYGVMRYTRGAAPLMKVRDGAGRALVEQRDNTELLIEEAERLLSDLTGIKPAQSVTEQMRKAKDTDMRVALKAWAAQLKEKAGIELAVEEEPEKAAGGDGG